MKLQTIVQPVFTSRKIAQEFPTSEPQLIDEQCVVVVVVVVVKRAKNSQDKERGENIIGGGVLRIKIEIQYSYQTMLLTT